MATDADFMARSLPNDTDFEDESGRYGSQFTRLLLTDDEYDWPRILGLYQDAAESDRRLINEVFMSLVGYSLPTIVELANSPEEL